MIDLINNISSIYDAKHYTSLHIGSVSVYEPNNATTKQVDIQKAGVDFYLLEQDFYKNQPNITTSKSAQLKDSDCDGIIFYEDECQKHLFAIELKSGFSNENIQGGYVQIFFTLLKIYTFLSICRNFDFKNYNISACLACQPIKNQAEESRIADNLLQKKTIGEPLTTVDEIIHNHIISPAKKVTRNIKDLEICKGVLGQNLPNDILDQTITFYLFTLPNYGAPHGTLKL